MLYDMRMHKLALIIISSSMLFVSAALGGSNDASATKAPVPAAAAGVDQACVSACMDEAWEVGIPACQRSGESIFTCILRFRDDCREQCTR